jgi:hypothetical protein
MACAERWRPLKLQQQRLLLLLLVLVASVDAAGGEDWHEHQYERCFIHAVVLIILVCGAMIFEMLWHSLTHLSKKTYHYGQVHDIVNNEEDSVEMDSNGNIRHVRLWDELTQRMGGEFMSLGFLAFTIFILNQAGFFDRLGVAFGNPDDFSVDGSSSVTSSPEGFHYPRTQYDWLHAAEFVHVKLFVAMILYFVLVSRLVRGAQESIRNWEELRLRHISTAAIQSEMSGTSGAARIRTKDVKLQELIQIRDYFTQQIVAGDFGAHHAGIRERILETLNIDPKVENLSLEILKVFDDHFSLSAYLALNVESAVMDTIQVHKVTWFVVIFLFGLFAIFHRYAKVSEFNIVVTFSIFAFCVLLVMWALTRRQWQRVHEFKIEDGIREESSTWPAFNLNTEKAMLRALQAFMFPITIFFADLIIDFQEWREEFEERLTEVLVFVVLAIVLAKFLREQVPPFLALMACPPHINEENMDVLFNVLFNDHPLYRASVAQLRPSDSSSEPTKANSTATMQVQAVPVTLELADIMTATMQAQAVPVTLELAEIMGRKEELLKRLRDLGYTEPERLPPAGVSAILLCMP